MAGLLSFATPVTFFPGVVSVMREAETVVVLVLTAWYVLFAVELWGMLLVIGYVLQHGKIIGRYAGSAPLLGACAAAAQAAQHNARRRLGQARLKAVQARIDPQLLFDMLDAVRRAYEDDASRAERLLDELASFLRAALPRLRNTSSSVLREAQLARAYAQLRTLAGAIEIHMRFDVSADVADARFPPGVLLPLLEDALRVRAGACELIATRSSDDCQLVLTLPARPLDAVVARVRSLLADLYGTSAELVVAHVNGVANATVKVPYELT